MKHSTLIKLVLPAFIALGSFDAKAQGRGQTPQFFYDVENIEIFTRDGNTIYSNEANEGKGNTGKTKIARVAKSNKSIKVFFDGKGEKMDRVVEILCRDCIVKIEYLWDEDKEEENETEGGGSGGGSGKGTGGGGGKGGKTK